jgi:hypothetical protein
VMVVSLTIDEAMDAHASRKLRLLPRG